MKHRMTFLVPLILAVLVSLMASETSVEAQDQIRVVADTGIVSLGPTRKLRLIVFDDTDGAETISFRRIEYTEGVCNGGVCKYSVSSQSQTSPFVIGQGEAFQLDIEGELAGHFRVVVFSNRSTVKVNAMIVDSATGEVLSIISDKATPKL